MLGLFTDQQAEGRGLQMVCKLHVENR